MGSVLEITNGGRVRTIRLNRPEKKNALSNELAWGIVTAVEEAARDDSVWVVAITGTGDAFCSGLDLGGSEPVSPLSEQDSFVDDIGWVGRFALVLRGIDSEGAGAVADRLRERIANLSIDTDRGPLKVTVSAGCASLSTTDEKTPEGLIAIADRRLYGAKHAGRNRVVTRG